MERFGAAGQHNYGLSKDVTASSGPPVSGLAYETPASLACLYHFVIPSAGCNPNTATAVPSGGSKAIGIVDAYDYPTAMADLNTFSAQFGLPAVTASNFKVVFAGGNNNCSGTDPGNDPGWEVEQALDIQWAHAMAPNAKIFLVDALSNSFVDLMVAEDCASQLVRNAGGGEVTNSWGGSEWNTEASFDSHFTAPGVVYFASTGDTPQPEYPSVSPNVVAVGGTTTGRINSGSKFANFFREAAWESGGGGLSLFEPRPSYQNVLPSATNRLVPDVSADANPNTGVYIYDNNAYYGNGWFLVGGTSVASPSWAGIANAAGQFAASSNAELTTIYNAYTVPSDYAADFKDITYGLCGFYDGYIASPKWDPCTGVGSPRGYLGK
jgi:kumamolisin